MNKTDLSAARSGSFKKQDVDKILDDRLTRGKTRKGAKHKVGKVFRPVKWFKDASPALYRRLHLGKKQGAPLNGYPRYY